MQKILDALLKGGQRKVVLGISFLVCLTAIGLFKKIESGHWKDCFETLCFCTFAANSAEHFAKKNKKEPEIPPAPAA